MCLSCSTWRTNYIYIAILGTIYSKRAWVQVLYFLWDSTQLDDFFYFGVKCRGINATLHGTRAQSGRGKGLCDRGWWVGVRVRKVARWGGGGGVLCSSSATTTGDITWAPNCWNYQALSYISEFIWCDPWNIWGPIWHSFSVGLLISFGRPYLGVQYIRNLRWRKFWDFLSPALTFGLLISPMNDEGSTGTTTAWPDQAIVAFDRPYPGVQYIQKLRWRKS